MIPSVKPSAAPTGIPTCPPSILPTIQPSDRASVEPSSCPSQIPTISPSSIIPSSSSKIPSNGPTIIPSYDSSIIPSFLPVHSPTLKPSSAPTSISPSVSPLFRPSSTPSSIPSGLHVLPSTLPTALNILQVCDVYVPPSTASTNIASFTVTQSLGGVTSTEFDTISSKNAFQSTVVCVMNGVSDIQSLSVGGIAAQETVANSSIAHRQLTSPSPSPLLISYSVVYTYVISQSGHEQNYYSNKLIAQLNHNISNGHFSSLLSTFNSLFHGNLSTAVVVLMPVAYTLYNNSNIPTSVPTFRPSAVPITNHPSRSPQFVPSAGPVQMSREPSASPYIVPSFGPSRAPSSAFHSTTNPSPNPTSLTPSRGPTRTPIVKSSFRPTLEPTVGPTATPYTESPINPTFEPSAEPSFEPTYEVDFISKYPTVSKRPSKSPTSTKHPSVKPMTTGPHLPTSPIHSNPTLFSSITPTVTSSLHIKDTIEPVSVVSTQPVSGQQIVPTVIPSQKKQSSSSSSQSSAFDASTNLPLLASAIAIASVCVIGIVVLIYVYRQRKFNDLSQNNDDDEDEEVNDYDTRIYKNAKPKTLMSKRAAKEIQFIDRTISSPSRRYKNAKEKQNKKVRHKIKVDLETDTVGEIFDQYTIGRNDGEFDVNPYAKVRRPPYNKSHHFGHNDMHNNHTSERNDLYDNHHQHSTQSAQWIQNNPYSGDQKLKTRFMSKYIPDSDIEALDSSQPPTTINWEDTYENKHRKPSPRRNKSRKMKVNPMKVKAHSRDRTNDSDGGQSDDDDVDDSYY